jgi:hypothetical protein
LGLRAGENSNAEQDTEQQAREILCDAIPRDGSLGLRRLDRSVEKRLNLGEAVGDEGAQLLVVRSHLEGRVDQETAAVRGRSPNAR